MDPRLATAAAVVVLSVLAAGDPAQQPDAPLFSARSELVVLHVMVKDAHGAYVPDLMPEAFTVLEDGHPQFIQFFARQDAAVDVGLLVDASGSMRTNRDRVVAAAGTFAETSNPQDAIFALAFNEHVRSALPPEMPFTSSSDTLRAALSGAIAARGRTALYDAISAGLDYVRRGVQPRKVLVVVSDGGDNASEATFQQVLRKTQTSNTVIYTIALTDPLERDANPKRLRQLAEASGGEAFEPRDISQVSEVLRQVARAIRNAYTLGYIPAGSAAAAGSFRRIRVVVSMSDRPRLSVRTRHGYLLEER